MIHWHLLTVFVQAPLSLQKPHTGKLPWQLPVTPPQKTSLEAWSSRLCCFLSWYFFFATKPHDFFFFLICVWSPPGQKERSETLSNPWQLKVSSPALLVVRPQIVLHPEDTAIFTIMCFLREGKGVGFFLTRQAVFFCFCFFFDSVVHFGDQLLLFLMILF